MAAIVYCFRVRSFCEAISVLFFAALRFEEKDLFPHWQLVSVLYNLTGNRDMSSVKPKIPKLEGASGGNTVWKVRCAQVRLGKEWRCCTNWIVFEHTQRLMRSRPLHCSIIARHSHRYEAHHDGT